MSHLNVEIKARCDNPRFIRRYLRERNADFRGTDEQTDTYFNVARGRLKIREGKIENSLIFYERENQLGPKASAFHLVPSPDPRLKNALAAALGVRKVVSKKREIYYLGNVKFHIDEVPGLGNFVEIEAGDLNSPMSEERLRAQCAYYMKEFGISEEDLVSGSYSDF
ncbi:MAG TPA: class IV adenylate cyclase [Chitinophagaceae bacterium]|nr:class IV adenylate cyclase [Chitinophagaceae bacterium]